ncbi:WG repeat-containing protein [Brevundimonas intermedia]|uniref:WG repeat-containing protein n=1 Tax=Brevundimonas intermedia TaxID=74315 RepID=UPI00320B3912
MRAAIITLALMCGLVFPATAADDPSGWGVRCGGPFQLCGYVERGTGTPRIPKRYEVAKPFRNGLAAVRVDGRWGYIDRSGDLVIQPVYTAAASFYGEFAEVRVNEAAGIIDRRGRVIISPQFKRIIPFALDVFIAVPLGSSARSDGLFGIDAEPAKLSGIEGAGLYHRRRGWLTASDLQFMAFDPTRGLIWAGRRNEDHEDVWGLMRADGSWQVTPRYSHVQWLAGGRAIVRSLPDRIVPAAERQASVLSGAVDGNGKLVVPMERRWLGYLRAGYGLADRTGRASGLENPTGEPSTGIVNLDGTLLAGRYFDAVDISEEGLLPRGRLGDVWYSIDQSGRLLPDQLEGTTLLDCPDGPSFIRRGARAEVRGPNGRSAGTYDTGHFQQRECPGPFSLERAGRWFIVMPDGRVLGGERGFDNTYGFSGDSAAVQLDGKWGIIDRLGRFTVSPRFDQLSSTGTGVFRVEGADPLWIDAMGRAVPEPQHPRRGLACEGGLELFQAGGRWGMRDGMGRTVIQPKHRVLTCFSEGFAWAVSPGAREWCPIGPDGERRRAFRCLEAVYPLTGSHQMPERFDNDPFESSVLWNLAMLDYLAGTRPDAPRWISAGRDMGSDSVIGGLPQPERVDSGDGGHEAVRRFAPYAVGVMCLLAFVISKRHQSRTAHSAHSTRA